MASDDITCERFIRTLAEDLAGELPADQRERNARHAARCADCRKYREDYAALVRASREAGREAPASLPDSLTRRILSSRHRLH